MDQSAVSSTVDARIRYLEQLSQQLANQLKVMKQLVASEVSDLKGSVQEQVAEIKSIVMHQDRVYQERIRRMETRMEQLSEFAMHIARAKGLTGVVGAIPTPAAEASGAAFSVTTTQASPSRAAAADSSVDMYAKMKSGRVVGTGPDQDAIAVDQVMNQYKEKIDAIYVYYTQSASHAINPSMALQNFTKLVKDCHLSNFTQGDPPPELLWMAVIRKLNRKRGGKKPGKTNFAHERLQDIPGRLFPEVLFVLAEERYAKQKQLDLSAAQMFEMFLVTDIFPITDMRISLAQTDGWYDGGAGGGAAGGGGGAMVPSIDSAVSLLDYDTEVVKVIIKQHGLKLRNSFESTCRKHDYRSNGMSLDTFVHYINENGLISLITKPDIRQIFLKCATQEVKETGKDKESPAAADHGSLLLLLPGFKRSLLYLTERIYGDRLYADKYPSPEARIRKLLSKLFLLH